MASLENNRKTLLFVVTEDWYFVSHRLPVARAAMRSGMRVCIATNVGTHGAVLRDSGIEVYEWPVRRGSTNLFSEWRAFWSLWRIYRQVRPEIAHHVAIKPVLYGSLAAKLSRTTRVVNALGGLGALFTSDTDNTRGLRSMVLAGFRWLLNARSTLLIVQNQDDRALLMSQAGVQAERMTLIRGAGVDPEHFQAHPEPGGIPLVVLPARMLLDKGVGEFVEAAAMLRRRGVQARFVLVGDTDPCNPAAISVAQLEQWAAAGDVEWLGKREDMPAIYASAAVVCLPSYREGLPKALLEAASSGRAIVTTDVPGCREVVDHGENGLLVPVRDATRLAEAIGQLLRDPQQRARMGDAGRRKVLDHFSERAVVDRTLGIYSTLLADAAP